LDHEAAPADSESVIAKLREQVATLQGALGDKKDAARRAQGILGKHPLPTQEPTTTLAPAVALETAMRKGHSALRQRPKFVGEGVDVDGREMKQEDGRMLPAGVKLEAVQQPSGSAQTTWSSGFWCGKMWCLRGSACCDGICGGPWSSCCADQKIVCQPGGTCCGSICCGPEAVCCNGICGAPNSHCWHDILPLPPALPSSHLGANLTETNV
jgi:hypothetical protein